MKTQLYVFTNGEFDQNRLQEIYLMNQSNVPAVGSLESIDKLRDLLSICDYHSVLLLDKNFIGFSICFREGASYWSENYKYFKGENQIWSYNIKLLGYGCSNKKRKRRIISLNL